MRTCFAVLGRLVIAASLITTQGCGGGDGAVKGYGVDSWPLSKTDPDEVAFPFDVTQPFGLALGRGSGSDGLETVVIESSGATRLHRYRDQFRDAKWEMASIHLDETAMAEIARKIVEEEIPQMQRGYRADVWDGTQWVLLIRQGGRSKRVYFNNHFPEAVQRLAMTIDRETDRCGLASAVWTPVAEAEGRNHEEGLW